MFGCDINRSILSDKAFQSLSFVIHCLFVYLTYRFTNVQTKLCILLLQKSTFRLRKMSTLTSKKRPQSAVLTLLSYFVQQK